MRAALSPRRAVAAATVAYAVVFFALGVDRYATFHAGADLGLFTQTVAGAFAGFSNTIEGTSHFAYHFSPILYLCAPLVWLAQSALALTFVQAAATAAIAPALFAIGRRRMDERWAAVVACVALLYPPLQGVTFTDFHEVAFVPAAAAWLLWAIDARRFGVAAVLLAVLLSVKEDQAPAMAFLGAIGCWYFAARNERAGLTFSAAAIVASLAVFAGYFTIVRPLAGAPAPWMPEHFYAWGRGGPEIPPVQQIAGRLTYLLEAFLPLAFLPLRSRVVALALPGFAEVLASREPLTYTMGQHYAAVWVPYVLVAFVVAAAAVLRRNPILGRRTVWTAAGLCAIVLAFFSPLHLGHFLGRPTPADTTLQQTIANLPRDAAIATYDEVYAHLGLYPRAAIALKPETEYVVYDAAYRSAYWTQHTFPRIKRARAEGRFALLSQRNGIVLLGRRLVKR